MHKSKYFIDWKTIKPKIEKLIEENKHTDTLEINTDSQWVSSSQNFKFLDAFYEHLKPLYLEYAHNTLGYPDNLDIEILHSWFNKYKEDGRIKTHNHTGAIISSVLYIEFPPNAGNLLFKDPYYDFKLCYSKNGDDSWLWKEVEIEEGDLLLFDAAIWHKTQPNKSNKERWVLGTNIGIVPKKSII
jgi:uncharacterized protein (TIGR02466 family)